MKIRFPSTVSILNSLFQRGSALNCYIYLILWIIIFSSGLYWILSRIDIRKNIYKREHSSMLSISTTESNIFTERRKSGESPNYASPTWTEEIDSLPNQFLDYNSELEQNNQHDSINRLCNHVETIKSKDELFIHENYKLLGLAIVFRHGDRGPLSHAGNRNLSSINCHLNHSDYENLFHFTQEVLPKLIGYSQFIGSFSNYPRTPSNSECSLGQLTPTGALQLITLGKLFRKIYKPTGLFWNFKSFTIVPYSTRYRRTYQSLISFLYGFLGSSKNFFTNLLPLRESQSISFCFNYCACKKLEKVKKSLGKSYKPIPQDQRTMNGLINYVSNILELEKTKKNIGPLLLDSLLVYSCHKSQLPCKTTSQNQECISPTAISTLIDLIRKENSGSRHSEPYLKYSLLSSYGLVKEIVSFLNSKMTVFGSSDHKKSKLALFSAHDTTLQQLFGALGINNHPDIYLPPFASRVIFEFYKKKNSAYYFRLIFNGDDITGSIKFCQFPYKIIKEMSNDNSMSNIPLILCPFDNFVTFLNEDYFREFSFSNNKTITNFRHVCQNS